MTGKMFSENVEDAQYSGGCSGRVCEYNGGCSVQRGGILSTVGDTLSTVDNVQYHRGMP